MQLVYPQVLALVPEGDYALPVNHKGVCKKAEAPGEYACKLYGIYVLEVSHVSCMVHRYWRLVM